MSDVAQPQKKWNGPAIIGLMLVIMSLPLFVYWLHLGVIDEMAPFAMWLTGMVFSLRGCIECRRKKGIFRGVWMGVASFGLSGAFVGHTAYCFYRLTTLFEPRDWSTLTWALTTLAGGALPASLVLVWYWLAKEAPHVRHG